MKGHVFRSGLSRLQIAGESKDSKLSVFQNPLHPMNRFAHTHAMLDKDS